MLPGMRRFRESTHAFREVFRNDGLRKLQLALVGSVFGAWVYTVAISVYAYEHGGATAVGVVAAARWIAAGLVSPFAGVLGDRYPRRLVMISSDGVRGSLIGLAAVLVASGAPSPIVYVVSIFITASATPFRPAEAALTPALARTPEELTASNVVSTTIESVGLFAGPGLGGLILAGFGTVTVFVVAIGCHVWSALLVSRIKVEEQVAREEKAAVEPEPFRAELAAGFKAMAHNPRLRLIGGFYAGQAFVDGLLNVLIIVLALKLLHQKAAVGYLNSAIGVGGLIGAAISAALVTRKRLASDFGVGILMWGVPIAVIAAWPNLGFALLMTGLVGVGNTVADVLGTTLLQRSAEEQVLARVFGVIESVGLMCVALGALLAPVLIAVLGTRGTMIVAGAVLPVVLIPAWPRLVAIDHTEVMPSKEIDLLRAIPIFSPLPEPVLERLTSELQPSDVPAGTTVFRRGDEGDRFYMIESGAVEVMPEDGPAVRLGPGDFFGEIALLRDVPRTATVTAIEPTRLYGLNWDSFVPAVTGYAPSRHAADTVIGTRLGVAGLARA
jgi:MFS family permease